MDAGCGHPPWTGVAGYTGDAEDATFVVCEHRIEYLHPAYVGDELEIRTWLDEVRRVQVHRRYEFVRKSDGKVVAQGETDWVYVERKTERSITSPANLPEVFTVVSDPD